MLVYCVQCQVAPIANEESTRCKACAEEKCFNCNAKLMRLRRMLQVDATWIKTKNLAEFCSNPTCFHYINPKNIAPEWQYSHD